jgi:hypothetical protein
VVTVAVVVALGVTAAFVVAVAVGAKVVVTVAVAAAVAGGSSSEEKEESEKEAADVVDEAAVAAVAAETAKTAMAKEEKLRRTIANKLVVQERALRSTLRAKKKVDAELLPKPAARAKGRPRKLAAITDGEPVYCIIKPLYDIR